MPFAGVLFKDGVGRISTFQNKAHQGIQLCLGDSGKYKEKTICARLIDDFDAEKYCDRNCREPTWSSALIQWSPLHCQIEKLPFNPVFKTG